LHTIASISSKPLASNGNPEWKSLFGSDALYPALLKASSLEPPQKEMPFYFSPAHCVFTLQRASGISLINPAFQRGASTIPITSSPHSYHRCVFALRNATDFSQIPHLHHAFFWFSDTEITNQ
jgi:hypothetical protein